MPAMPPEQKREYLITYLTDVIILSQAAEQQKLGDSPEVKRQIAFERNKVLMEALLQNAAKAAETDAEMHKVYDEAVKQMGAEQEVHARHILVDTEEEAKAIEAELKERRGFRRGGQEKIERSRRAPTAAILAISPRTRWCRNSPKPLSSSTRDRFPTRYTRNSAGTSSKSKTSAPSRRRRSMRSRAQVENYIAHRAQAQLVDSLRKTATIERLDQPQAPSPDAQSRRACEEVTEGHSCLVVVAGLDPAIHHT